MRSKKALLLTESFLFSIQIFTSPPWRGKEISCKIIFKGVGFENYSWLNTIT